MKILKLFTRYSFKCLIIITTLVLLNQNSYCQNDQIIKEKVSKMRIKFAESDFVGSKVLLEEIRTMIIPYIDNNVEYVVWINSLLAICYNQLGDYAKATYLLFDFLNYEDRLYKNIPEEYSIFLESVCSSLIMNRQSDWAEKILLEIKERLESSKHTNSTAYSKCYYSLGALHESKGNVKEAMISFKKALEIQQNNSVFDPNEIANISSKLVSLYLANGNYEKAESAIIEVKNLLILKSDTNSIAYCTLLVDQANFYSKLNNLKKAVFVMKKAVELSKKIDATGFYYLNRLILLAGMEGDAGNYDEMILIFEKAIKLGQEIKDYPKMNLLDIYSSYAGYIPKYDFNLAEKINLEALKFIKENNFDNSIEAAGIFSNLAILYSFGKKQNLDKSLFFAIKSNKIYKGFNGINNPRYINSLSLLSSIYYSKGNYDSSLILSTVALRLAKENLGQKNFLYIEELLKMANNFEAKKDYANSVRYLEEWNVNFKNLISENYLQLVNNELEMNNDLKSHFETFDNKLNSFSSYKIKSEMNGISYDNKLFIKNLILRNWISINKNIQIDSNSRNIYSQLTKVKSALLKFYSFPSQDLNDINKLETKKDSLETNLIKISPFYKNIKSQLNISWQNIGKVLKTDEAAIEFGSFGYFLKDSTPSDLYFALVLRKGYSNPEYVPLFFKSFLDKIMTLRASMSDSLFLNNLYSFNTGILYEMIWKPLDSLLQGVKTIYASPSGILNKINLGAIPINADSTFGTKYNLHILGTTANIINYSPLQINKNTIDNAYLFGGIDYDRANNSATISNNSEDNNYAGLGQVATSAERGYVHSWSYLPGTLKEGSEIQSLCNNAGIKTTLLTGRNASENNFKSLSGSSKPFILHLATHGYFFPDIKKEKSKEVSLIVEDRGSIYKSSENPLLRSGLILAGANKAWGNDNYKSDSTEDGILTAYEVSNTDLSKAQLVVMSACETGLGDINGSEGVFGLQRGFKLAGAKDIIMSLWKVPDAQTSKLLTLLYQNCFHGLSVHESLKQAQLKMSKKYPAYYWAGFVLLE